MDTSDCQVILSLASSQCWMVQECTHPLLLTVLQTSVEDRRGWPCLWVEVLPSRRSKAITDLFCTPPEVYKICTHRNRGNDVFKFCSLSAKKGIGQIYVYKICSQSAKKGIGEIDVYKICAQLSRNRNRENDVRKICTRARSRFLCLNFLKFSAAFIFYRFKSHMQKNNP